MRREKSLRIGVHHANAVVWGPVYRTHLTASSPLTRAARRRRRRRRPRYHRARSAGSPARVARQPRGRERRRASRKATTATRRRRRDAAGAPPSRQRARLPLVPFPPPPRLRDDDGRPPPRASPDASSSAARDRPHHDRLRELDADAAAVARPPCPRSFASTRSWSVALASSDASAPSWPSYTAANRSDGASSRDDDDDGGGGVITAHRAASSWRQRRPSDTACAHDVGVINLAPARAWLGARASSRSDERRTSDGTSRTSATTHARSATTSADRYGDLAAGGVIGEASRASGRARARFVVEGETLAVAFKKKFTGGLKPKNSKNLPSLGIPGRFLSLVLIQPNRA